MKLGPGTSSVIQFAVRLVNSAKAPQSLATVEQLQAMGAGTQLLKGGGTELAGELSAIQATLPQLSTLFTSNELDLVASINAVLRKNGEPPQLVQGSEGEWLLQPIIENGTLADRILVASATAMTEVLASGELSRVGVCSASDCAALTFDLSKNRSRKFCSDTCCNRQAAAAYRMRASKKNKART